VILKAVQDSSFDKVKIYLNDKKEDYLMCLKLLLNEKRMDENKSSLKTDVFDWIHTKINLLKQKIGDDNSATTVIRQS